MVRHRITRHATSVMLPVILGACSVAGRTSNSVDLQQRRVELSRVHAAAAQAARGDFVDALTGVMAEDGIYGAAVATAGVGRRAAREFLLRDSLNARSTAIWEVVRLDVSADGGDGYSLSVSSNVKWIPP